ncbi:Ig-like domain-containing protein [Pontibacter russatus]|uniref:Ig-like domain-containing protein n=1 Tax=Pontibacter russatus TaxID=2694929 RepID=UPI00137A3CF3|nr:T9SS type A sorting domain-containing protein [Pontibacter russatus]
MQNNFTKLIAHFLSSRRTLFPALSVMVMLATAIYLHAAVGITVTGGSPIAVSADKASNATLTAPAYTTIGPINFTEGSESSNDFGTVSKTIEIKAPSGWQFYNTAPHGVTVAANQIEPGNKTISATVTSVTNNTVTITYSNAASNKREEIVVSGIRVIAVDGASAPETLTLTAGGALFPTAVNVLSINHTHGAARKIAFGTQPSNVLTGNTLTTSPTVLIQDQFGNTVTSGAGADALVTVAIGTNPAGSNGVLNGTKTVNAVSGVAAFSELSIDAAGAGYTLVASSTLPSNGTTASTATSSAFNVNSKVPTLNAPTACVSEGDGSTIVTLTGTNFEKNSLGRVNNSPRSTKFISSTELEVTLLEGDLATAGDINISVLNPAPPADNVSTSQLLNIKPLLHASSIVGERTVCAGTEVLYTAPEGFSDFKWSSTAGGTVEESGDNPALVRFLPTASGTVTISLSAKNACGVTSSASIVVDVKPAPQAVIEYNSTSFCENGSLELSAFINPSELDNYNYEWYKLGSNDVYELVGDNSPAYITEEAGTFRLTVTGENSACSQTSDPVVITVNPLPTVSITGLGSDYCSSDQAVTLAGSPVGGTFRILQGTSVVDEDATTFNPSALDAGNYIVEYSYADENTCVNTTTQTVTVKPQPVLTISSDSPGGICPEESAVLTASGADSYEWSPSAGLSATSGASVTAKPTITTTYTVIGTTNGCESEPNTVTVTVNPLPDVTITPTGPTEFCLGNYVDLVAVDDPFYNYQWFKNGSSISEATNSTYRVDKADGTGNYHVTITTDAGCELSSETIAVKVADVPTTATIITTGATTFCQGGSVKFDANKAPSGQTYVYQWQKSTTTSEDADFTNIEGAVNSSLVTNESGYYRVLVSNTDEADEDTELCTKTSAAVGVTVYPQPEAAISGENPPQCANADGSNSFTVTGTFVGSGATWSSNNPNFEIIVQSYNIEEGQTTAIVTTTGAGNAIISLTASRSSTGCTEAIATQNLTVHPLPVATITADGPVTFCEGGSVKLTASAGSSWLWSTGATTQSITVDESGDYSVEVFNSNGCSATSAATAVTENELPTVTLAAFEPVCKNGDSFTLSGGLPAGGTYTVDGVAATQFNPAAAAVGNHTIVYTYQDDNNCSASATQTIEVKAVPTVTLGTFADVCVGAETVTLSGGLPVGGTYSGTGVSNGQFNPATASVGTHTITYTYEANGCTNTATSTIKVTPVPTATLAAFSNVCVNAAAFTLTGGSPAGGTYSGTGVSNGQFNPATAGAGTHTITYTYGENGCTVSTTGTITVNPLPTASISFDGSTTLCQGSSLLLTGNSNTGTSYIWYRNNVQVATTPTYAANQTGSYTVRAINGNNCTSDLSAAVQVTVSPAITGNTISGAQTVCSGGSIAALGQASNATLAGGATPYAYQWQSSPNNSTWTNIATGGASASYTPPVQNVTTTTTTYYRRVVSGGGCSSTSTAVAVTVTQLPTVNFTGIEDGATIYSGQGNITLTGSPSGGTWSWPGGTSRTFSPCTAFNTAAPAGAAQVTIPITYTVTSGACKNSITKNVTIKQSTYKAVVTSSLKPFCQGDNVIHTVRVWRDATVIYPYLTNAAGDPVRADGSLVGPQELPVANPNYEFPAGTPEGIKLVAWRYFNPIVKGDGVEITSGLTYQWTKNQENNIGNKEKTLENAGLSSLDYYAAYVTVDGGTCGPNFTQRISSRTYTAEQADYSITLSATPQPVCQGASVTLTATLNSAFPYWNQIGLNLQWNVTRGGTTSVLGNTTYTGNNSALQLVTNGPTGGFLNGDVVSILFTSDLDSRDVAGTKCAGGKLSTEVTLNVNDIAVVQNPAQQNPVICLGGQATFTAPVTTTGPATETYTWKVGTTTYTTTEPSLSIPAEITGAAGSYPVSVIVSNTCETTSTLALGTLTVKPALAVFNVSGGGSYCAGSPVSYQVKLSGSQTGVNYTLLRDATVVETKAGTGQPLSFTATSATGSYTISAAYVAAPACSVAMSGSTAITVNALPTVTVQNQVTCVGTPATVSAVITEGTGPYTYKWSVPTGWTGPKPTSAIFQTTVAGNYTVEIKDGNLCPVTATGSVTINEPTPQNEPILEVMWINNDSQWEVKVVEKDPLDKGELGLATNPTITWYRRVNPSQDWGDPVQESTSTTYIENAPKADVEIKAVLLNSASCTRYELTNIGVAPLPVEIIYLNASKQGNNVVLEWATAMEEDNAGFEVQVSTDGFSYRKLTFVPAKNGNSNMKQVYAFTDRENGKFGTRYYRLKQLDTYGTFEFFGPKAVTFGSVASKVIAFPNPFHDEVTLDIAAEVDGEALITVTDAVGKKLLERKVQVAKGFTTEKLRLDAGLPIGLYIIKVQVGGFTQYIKMIKE